MSAHAPFSLYDLSFFDRANTVAVMVSYYDASEIGDHLAIGGLLFRKKNVRPFEKKWRAMLREFEIDYFHMTDCNAQEGPFKGKTKQECDSCARMALEIIFEFAQKGVIFNVTKTDFYEIITENGVMPNPLTLGIWQCLFDVRFWREQNDPTARVAYVFESGDTHQRDVEHFMRSLAEDPERSRNYGYNGHAFLPKRCSLPTQAADILAWHGAKHADRRSRGITRLRGDFDAIVNRILVSDATFDRARLQSVVDTARSNVDGPDELVRLAFLVNETNRRRFDARWRAIHEGLADAKRA